LPDLIALEIADETTCWRLVYSLLATQALDLEASAPGERPVATPVPVTRMAAERPGTYRLGGRKPGPGQKGDAPSLVGADDAGELGRKIETLAASFGSLDCFELLGVRRDVDSEEIERAWTAQRERFDPERLGALGLGNLREAALSIQHEL